MRRGYAAGVLVDGVKHAWAEDRLVGGAGALEPMLDVGLGVLLVERAEVAAGGHPLAQLQHARALQNLSELGLPDQEGLQQGLFTKLEVGQHAQFFDRLRLQVLRFVHDQQAALALRGLGDEEGFERHQHVGLARRRARGRQTPRRPA